MRRLILFDIDGTLLTTGGRAGAALAVALEDTFGLSVSIEGYCFAGKTDPQIVLELMTAAGVEEAVVRSSLHEALAGYAARLGEQLPPGSVQVLPGVTELLTELQRRPDVAIGLLTGNTAAGARVKLARAGLEAFFAVGAFGSDNEDRNALVEIARRRAETHFKETFPPERTVVLGDATADIRCARAGGVRAVAVASGGTPLEELARLQPDALLESLCSPRTLAALLEDAA